MKTFTEYLDKMGYSWNDFDRTYEMENLIEQYADEKVNQALSIHDVSSLLNAEREATKEEIRKWLRGEDFEGLAERI